MSYIAVVLEEDDDQPVTVPADRYTEMPPLGPCDAGDPGGDSQMTSAYSRRFVRDLGDGTFAVVEVETYAVNTEGDPDKPPRPVLTFLFEYRECTDPIDPDSVSLAEYSSSRDVPRSPGDADPTDEDARAVCAAFDPATLTWAGEPHPTA